MFHQTIAYQCHRRSLILRRGAGFDQRHHFTRAVSILAASEQIGVPREKTPTRTWGLSVALHAARIPHHRDCGATSSVSMSVRCK